VCTVRKDAPVAQALVPHFFKSTYIAQPRWGFAGGLRPCGGVCFQPRIIYDGNESINNSRKMDTRRRSEAPPGRSPKAWLAAQRPRISVAGGATPLLDNTRVLSFYEFVLVFKPFIREHFRNSSFTIFHRRKKVTG